MDAIVTAIEREAGHVREEAWRAAETLREGAQRDAATLLGEARREAEALRAEAQREGELRLAGAQARADALLAERQARIAALSDELLRKSEAITGRLGDADPARRGFEHLIRALSDTAERLARLGAASGPGESAELTGPPYRPDDSPAWADPAPQAATTRQPHAPAGHAMPPHPDPVAPAATGAQPAAAADDAPRIVASEMANAGASRASVRAYLSGAMGISEPEPFLDEAFGRIAS